jgi:hypothetical protein
MKNPFAHNHHLGNFIGKESLPTYQRKAFFHQERCKKLKYFPSQ